MTVHKLPKRPPPPTVHITSDGVAGRVHVDGKDISGACIGVNLHLRSTHLAEAQLDLRIDRVDVDGITTVRVPQSTYEALVALGWTPPEVPW